MQITEQGKLKKDKQRVRKLNLTATMSQYNGLAVLSMEAVAGRKRRKKKRKKNEE